MTHDTVPYVGATHDKGGSLRRPENLITSDLTTLERKLDALPADRRAKIEERARDLIDTNGAVVFEVWFRSAPNEQADAVMEDIKSFKRAKEIAEENIQRYGFNVANIIGYDEDSNRVYDTNVRRGRSEVIYD